jgi:hypothetical protein
LQKTWIERTPPWSAWAGLLRRVRGGKKKKKREVYGQFYKKSVAERGLVNKARGSSRLRGKKGSRFCWLFYRGERV